MSIRIRVTEREAERLEKINPNKSLALQMLFTEYDDTKRRNKDLQNIMDNLESIETKMDILESIEAKIDSISESVIPKLIEG